MENPFWTYSLGVYREDAVRTRCLALQDEWGLDVNLLLYAAWLASQGVVLTPGHLEAVERAVAGWRGDVVRPLRALRRSLKAVPAAQDIRTRVAQLELDAESQQQDLMFGCYREAEHQLGGTDVLAQNLALVAGLSDSDTGQLPALVQGLAAALGLR